MTIWFWLLWIFSLAISTFVGAWIVRKYRKYGFAILVALLAIYVTSANIMVPRLITFKLGWTFVMVSGSIMWAFVAQLADMIHEIYGKRAAYIAAGTAYGANLMFVLFFYLCSQAVPLWSADQEIFWQGYFGIALRVFLASGASYILGNWADINIFAKIRRKYWNREKTSINLFKYSVLRSFLSDFMNQSVEGVVFYLGAFAGLMAWPELWALLASAWVVKIIIGQIDLPFYYIFRLLTKDVEREI